MSKASEVLKILEKDGVVPNPEFPVSNQEIRNKKQRLQHEKGKEKTPVGS